MFDLFKKNDESLLEHQETCFEEDELQAVYSERLEVVCDNDKESVVKEKNPKTKKKTKKDRIKSVMEKTGWSYEETVSAIETVKERFGMTYMDYDKYDLYKVPLESFNSTYFELRWKAKQKSMCINETVKKTGWSKKDAVSHINSARKRLGISYNDYRKYRFYRIAEEEQAEKYDEIVKQKQARKEEGRIRFIREREHHIKNVMDATGWNRQFVLEMWRRCATVAGCDYEHYDVYKLYDLNEEEQKTYFTARYTMALRKRYNIDPEIIHIFRNKDKTCELLKDFLGRPWLSTVDMSFEEFVNTFKNETKIIYKPLASYGGKQVQVFEISEKNNEEVYNELMSLPDGIVEGFLKQHPDMAKLSLKSVNTIRVATVKSNQSFPNVEQDKLYILYAGLRVGCGSSYVDNLHSGGLICGINLETGVVDTDGVDLDGYSTPIHPDTGVTFVGFKIPFWEEMKQMLAEAAKTFKTGYFGWDIAFTEDGPVVIEVNTSPGSVILQTPYVPLKRGMGHMIAPYVDPEDVAVKYTLQIEDEEFLDIIIRETGWTRDEALKKVSEAYDKYGATCENYAVRRYWEYSDEEMANQFTDLHVNLLRAKFNRDRNLMKIVSNKELSCTYFEKYMNRKWMSTRLMDFKYFKEVFGKSDRIVYKSAAVSGGSGIEIFSLKENNFEEVFRTTSEYREGIIEEYIVQHPDMEKLSLNSVNTIRVVTIKTDKDIHGTEKNKNNVIYCALRCGMGGSYVDNLKIGELVAIVNKETGIVETDAVDNRNNVYEKHPDTGVVFKGYQIPMFKEIISLVEEASQDIQEAFLGWDIAITADGPVLVEINSNPGASLLQAPYLPMHKGMKSLFEKYLK